MKRTKKREITDYDTTDTTTLINPSKKMSLADLGIQLPPTPPTQVVSLRLPTQLLNIIRSKASAQDIPYQALIKLALAKSFH